MKVTLQVNGREMTFSKVDNISIVEENVTNKAVESEQKTDEITPKLTKVHEPPNEDVWFEVNPQTINLELFNEERSDYSQEKMRQLILQALEQVQKNPQRYNRKFKTMFPVKHWDYKSAKELEEIAKKLGNHLTNQFELALEWAQKITNGQSWDEVNKDSYYYRLISWNTDSDDKIKFAQVIDNSCIVLTSASDDPYYFFGNNCMYRNFAFTVPLVTVYN